MNPIAQQPRLSLPVYVECPPSLTASPIASLLSPPSLSQAFDDTELSGSADDLLLGGPFQALSPYLFAVRFSRDCTGKWAVGRAEALGIIKEGVREEGGRRRSSTILLHTLRL